VVDLTDHGEQTLVLTSIHRTFAIGDIHGCHAALAALDRAIGFRADDVIVTLGLADQTDSMLFWEFFDAPLPHHSGRRMICGHTPQHSGLPLNLGHAVCIDTWVQRGGWLTCLDTGSNIYWQSNQSGEVRSGALE